MVYFVKRSYVVEVVLTKEMHSINARWGVDSVGAEHGGHLSDFHVLELDAHKVAIDNAEDDIYLAKRRISELQQAAYITPC